MMLARLHYNESVYIKLWVQNVPNLQATLKILDACTHALLSPPNFNVEMWFQSNVAKTTLQNGREDNMQQKYKCLKIFEWAYGIKIHVLGKELFCNQLFAFAAKSPNLVYSERCSNNLLREQYHPFAFLCPH